MERPREGGKGFKTQSRAEWAVRTLPKETGKKESSFPNKSQVQVFVSLEGTVTQGHRAPQGCLQDAWTEEAEERMRPVSERQAACAPQEGGAG